MATHCQIKDEDSYHDTENERDKEKKEKEI